jgi:OmpA-OmpF porin, OOP family
MKKLPAWIAALALVAAPLALAQDELRAQLFAQADARLEAAKAADAEQLSPSNYEQAMARYHEAESDLARGRNIERIRSGLNEAVHLLDQAIDAAEIAKITLASLIKTRDDAQNANAPTLSPELWTEAQKSFDEAARRLEYGNIRVAREVSDEAETQFRDAELTAIKAQYLSRTRSRILVAQQMHADKYAPRTLKSAQDLLQQAEMQLNENRYDTDYPRSLVQQANYQAEHAIYLAGLIKQIDDGDITAEDVVLDYEQPLTQIAAAADRVAELDQGTDEITAELIQFIEMLREDSQQSAVDLGDARKRIAELEDEIRDLDEQLGGVSQERVALVQRLEAEARIRDQFTTIENMFGRDEARVSREGNNLILRLVGLSFASGRSDIAPEQRALLQKVAQAAAVFPESQIVVEGHTDSYGSDDANMRLSRERADAVVAYLTNEFGLPAFRISAVGYGETQPIANNETPQGRERNRRIDVRIEPQVK